MLVKGVPEDTINEINSESGPWSLKIYLKSLIDGLTNLRNGQYCVRWWPIRGRCQIICRCTGDLASLRIFMSLPLGVLNLKQRGIFFFEKTKLNFIDVVPYKCDISEQNRSTTITIYRMSCGQGKVREIPDLAKVREKSGNFVEGQGKNEYWEKSGKSQGICI